LRVFNASARHPGACAKVAIVEAVLVWAPGVYGLSAEAFADAVRSRWSIENNLHWTLDVTFNEDQSRLRAGHGAKNMAVVRHFALIWCAEPQTNDPSDAANAPLGTQSTRWKSFSRSVVNLDSLP
jgi:Transposase DDE domain